jgi:hypothetical protein
VKELYSQNLSISKGQANSNQQETRNRIAGSGQQRSLPNEYRSATAIRTQYKSDGPNQPYRLYKIESGVTDDLRRIMMVPSLAEAKAREEEMNKER